jgi:hypothetical protein
MFAPRVQVTGLGSVFPFGLGKIKLRAEYGAPGDDPTGKPPGAEGSSADAAAEDPRAKVARWLDPVAKNAIAAVGDAVRDAGISDEMLRADPFGYGIVSGSKYGPVTTRERAEEALTRRGSASATFFSHSGYNMAAAMAAVAYGCRGPNLTLSAPSSLGAVVVRRAVSLLAKGRRPHTLFTGFSETFRPPKSSAAAAAVPEAAAYVCLSNEFAPDTGRPLAVLEVLSREVVSRSEAPPATLLRQHYSRFVEEVGRVFVLGGSEPGSELHTWAPSSGAPSSEAPSSWAPSSWAPCNFDFDPDYLFILQLGLAASQLAVSRHAAIVLPQRVGGEVVLFLIHAGTPAADE